MTRQEIFNKVCKHLIKQNEKAINDFDSCQYRTDDGLRCAAGCLIPKKMYSPEIEGTSFSFHKQSDAAIALEKIARKLNLYRHRELIQRLQNIHDHNGPDNWKNLLLSLAKEFKLKTPNCLKN